MPRKFSYQKKTKSDIGWEIYPEGLYKVLLKVEHLNIPIIITENGVADETDKLRKVFIKEHLQAVYQAIQKGVPIKGYIYWSLTDNFEWALGRKACFGLISIDYQKGLRRSIRASADYFSKICKENEIQL